MGPVEKLQSVVGTQTIPARLIEVITEIEEAVKSKDNASDYHDEAGSLDADGDDADLNEDRDKGGLVVVQRSSGTPEPVEFVTVAEVPQGHSSSLTRRKSGSTNVTVEDDDYVAVNEGRYE